MGAETVDEEDEPTESPRTGIMPFSFGKGSSVSSSPRPSHATSRQSEDSSQANVHKRSFDTINSQMSSKGTLYALAQESLSATSLGRPAPRDGILSKFSALGRSRTPTIGSAPLPPSPPAPTQPSRKQRYQPPPPLMKSYDTNRSGHETYDSRQSTDYSAGDSIHPYANPDLMPRPPVVAPPVSPMSVQFPRGPSESWESRHESSYSTQYAPKVAASPPISPISMQFPRSKPEPSVNTQRTSYQRNKRTSSVHGRGISSPIAVQGSALPASLSNESNLGNTLPGWTDRVVPPSFSLISLEEARAQQGKNAAPADDLARTFSSNTTISSTAHEESGASMSSAASTRSRGRTVSAGAKAKNAIQSMVGSAKLDRRDSEPAVPVIGKTLKHKKSGFMRLFNKEAPPPVPPLSLTTSLDNEKKSAGPQPPARDYAGQTRSPTKGHKHSPPNLHISTHASEAKPVLTTSVSPTDNGLLTKPWVNSSQPHSAPADVTAFPALRLRPVSTLFSAHFENFVPELQSNAHEHDRDIDTPTSSSPPEHISPITPGPNTDFFPSTKKTGFDTQTVTIKALREELASSKVSSERRIRDLESQIRELKLEVEELRSADWNRRSRSSSTTAHCDNCSGESQATVGYLSSSPQRVGGSSSLLGVGNSVLNRPRAKTGAGSRFVNPDS
ncbi:hypothetical protein BKA70DRAFT_1367430 [Coprinopsis sp. MPI-PUGE-AT-0042]|nr:hypothetical protein BKA70DRAFT_1367430 [Coprinopsis sp. MPI-PUGE-AT-0042]